MRVVAGGDHHGVDRVVGQQAPVVGGAALEAEPPLGVGRRQPGRGRHLDQPDVGPVAQVGQEHAGGVAAGPDHAEPDHRPGDRPAGRSVGRAGGGLPALRRPVGRVAEQHADAAVLAALDPLVGADRVVERQHRGDERVEVEPALGHQVQEAGHVAPFGPADVADRVVDPVLLVGRVVASGAVRAREADLQLLGVVLGPGQVQAALADVDDPGPVPGQLGGELDRLVGVAAGGEEDVVGPGAVGEGGERLQHRAAAGPVGWAAGGRPAPLGQPAPLGRRVEADHVDPGGPQELHEQLPDQAEADDAGGLPEPRLRLPVALHGDGAHGGEGGVLGGDRIGQGHAQVARDPVVLGVEGVAVAGAGDPLPDGQLLHAGAHLDDLAAQRVAERRVGVEPVADLPVGGAQPLLGHRLHDLLHLVGPGARLADQRELALVDLHHLGAGGDERELRADQHTTRPRGGHRDLEHGQLTGPVVLGDLLHAVAALLPVPDLEGQQLPDLLGPIGGAAAVVVDHRPHHLLVHQPGGDQGPPGDQVLDHVRQVAADPGPQRRARRGPWAGTRSPWAATPRPPA